MTARDGKVEFRIQPHWNDSEEIPILEVMQVHLDHKEEIVCISGDDLLSILVNDYKLCGYFKNV